MKRHLASIPGTVVCDSVFGPLVRLGQEQAVAKLPVHVRAELLKKRIGLREVLAIGPLPLVEIGNRVQTHPVNAHFEPEIHDLNERPDHRRIIKVQVRLV